MQQETQTQDKYAGIEVTTNKVPVDVTTSDAEEKKTSAETTSESETLEQEKPELDDESNESAEDDEAQDQDSETESKEDDKGENHKKKAKGGFQRKINKLTREKRELERELEYWKKLSLKEKEAIAKEDPTFAKEMVKSAKSDDGRPRSDDFESYDDYLEAMIEWKADQKLKAREEKEVEQKLISEYRAAVDSHTKRIEEFKKEVTDFDRVIAECVDVVGEDFIIPAPIERLIVSNERGPSIIYELAKDPEKLLSVSKMSAVDAAREIGKLEARIESRKSSSKKEVVKKSNAPAPIEPVGSASAAATRKSLQEIAKHGTQAEYEAFRREQMKNRSPW